MRSLQGGEHRLTKLGKGFFRDKFYEYLVHAPVIIRGRSAQRAERGRLRAQRLAAGERAGRGHDEAPGPPHRRSRWRSDGTPVYRGIFLSSLIVSRQLVKAGRRQAPA